MPVCECGYEAKSAAGLASHRRAKHQGGRSMVEAVEVTLGELERLGRFERVDAARVQAVRSMAVSLDARSGNSQMWSVFWSCLDQLTKADDDVDDRLAAAVDDIRRAAPLGDETSS